MVGIDELRRRYYLEGLVADGQQIEIHWHQPGKVILCPACKTDIEVFKSVDYCICSNCCMEIDVSGLEWPLPDVKLEAEPEESEDEVVEVEYKPVGPFEVKSKEEIQRAENDTGKPPQHHNARNIPVLPVDRDKVVLMITSVEADQSTLGLKDLVRKKLHDQGLPPNEIDAGLVMQEWDAKPHCHVITFYGKGWMEKYPRKSELIQRKGAKPLSNMTKKGGKYIMSPDRLDARLGMGKHNGKSLSDLAKTSDGRSYLKWMTTQDFPDYLKKAVEHQLQNSGGKVSQVAQALKDDDGMWDAPF